MTPEQLRLVRATAALVEEAGDGFACPFYDRLFEIRPAARRLFPHRTPTQRAQLVDDVVFLARTAHDLDAFVPRARAVGQRHRADGVHTDDYPFVGDALLHAVALVAGERWSSEAAEAWHVLHCLIAETMLEGAAGALFSPSAFGCGAATA
jgi:hemoglobin-like flavoprotein